MGDHNSKKDLRNPPNSNVFDHETGEEIRRLTNNGLAGLDDAEELSWLGHLATISRDNDADDPLAADDREADELKVKQAVIKRLARLPPLKRALQEKPAADFIGIPVTMLRKLVSLEVNNVTPKAGGG